MKLNGNVSLNTDGTGEIQNAYIERLASSPTFNTAQKGRIYFNTTQSLLYFNDGAAWVPMATGGNATAIQTEIDNVELALGTAVNSNGTFNPAALTGLNVIATATSFTDALTKIDTAISASGDSLSGLADVTVSALANKDVLYFNQSLSKWQNAPAGAVSNVQPFDAGLTSLSTISGPGFLAVDASGDVFVSRTIKTPDGGGLAIENGTGLVGDLQITLTNDLAGLEGLSTNGIAVRRSGEGNWVVRDIVGGSTITVTNGDGDAGDISLDLSPLTIPTNAGSFNKFIHDTFGRITSVEAVDAADITALVDSSYVNVGGDTMSGALNMGDNKITNVANPTAGADAVNKNYVDAAAAGISSWKESVRVATTANVSLSATTNSIDGITIASGDRILVKDQTNTTENGIYVFNGTGLTRAVDSNTEATLKGAATFVTEGTTFADTGWLQVSEITTIGSDAVSFVQFTGGTAYTAGAGLDLTGNTFSVNVGAGIVELPADGVGIDLYNVSGNPLILTVDGTTRSTDTDAALALLLSGTSLEADATGLKVAANGITKNEINSSALGNGLTGGSGLVLEVSADDTTITTAGGLVAIKDAGVTTAKIADDAVTNVKLANKGVTVSDGSNVIDLDLGTTLTLTGSAGITVAANATTKTVDVSVGSLDLNDLSDVAVSSPIDGQTLVRSGTDFINKKVYHLYDGASNTTHSVLHSIGQKYCSVTVVDSTDEVIMPQSITFVDDNNLTVTFTSAIACKVIVMGV